jgi:hypothetical protein
MDEGGDRSDVQIQRKDPAGHPRDAPVTAAHVRIYSWGKVGAITINKRKHCIRKGRLLGDLVPQYTPRPPMYVNSKIRGVCFFWVGSDRFITARIERSLKLIVCYALSDSPKSHVGCMHIWTFTRFRSKARYQALTGHQKG